MTEVVVSIEPRPQPVPVKATGKDIPTGFFLCERATSGSHKWDCEGNLYARRGDVVIEIGTGRSNLDHFNASETTFHNIRFPKSVNIDVVEE